MGVTLVPHGVVSAQHPGDIVTRSPRFVHGLTLKDALDPANHSTIGLPLPTLFYLRDALLPQLSEQSSSIVGRPFKIYPLNVKISVDQKSRTIIVTITDLAANIFNSYADLLAGLHPYDSPVTP